MRAVSVDQDPETRQQSLQWKRAHGLQDEKKKGMAAQEHNQEHAGIFYDMCRLVQSEFIPQGQIVNAEYNCYILRHVRENKWCK